MVSDRKPCPTCRHLREENARLKKLLKGYSMPWEDPVPTTPESQIPPSESPARQISTAEKITLFRRLFRGRSDVYPVRCHL